MRKRGRDSELPDSTIELSKERASNGSDVAMVTPPNTPAPSAEQRAVYLDAPNVATALQVYNGQHEYVFPNEDSFTMGASSRCDIPLPGSGLSKVHLRFERRGDRLRVSDQESTYGTFLTGHRIRDAEYIHPGDVITPVPMSFLVMNNIMRAHRGTVIDILGPQFKADEWLVDAVKGSSHLLFLGELGCDAERLARAIHDVSPRRLDELVKISHVPDDPAEYRGILERARRSTLLILVPPDKPSKSGAPRRVPPPFNASFCALAFSGEYRNRVIAVAASTTAARRVLPDDIVEQMAKIWIPPIAMRLAELPELFDRLLSARGASFRFDELTVENRNALFSHHWRDNFIGLRTTADRLIAISRVKDWHRLKWRPRADATGIPKSTLNDWYVALRLSHPLIA